MGQILPWNDKYLDYEIETISVQSFSVLSCRLETTSTSITRLKRAVFWIGWQPLRRLKRQVPRLRDWNCRCGTDNSWIVDKLETTSTSITRLKLDGYHYPLQYSALTWNDKYLDYEIETRYKRYLPHRPKSLKRQVPRLRDWNRRSETPIGKGCQSLKRQVPRLRDWNA